MGSMTGRTALVMGAAGEIGAAIAAKLSSNGVKVFTAPRGPDPVHAWIEADFLDPEAPARVISEVMARADRLDILVNNAGIMRAETALDTSQTDWAETLHVYLTVPFVLIQQALPHLIDHGARS